MPETTGGSFLDNIYLSIEAAITGVGAAIAPLVLVEDDLRSGGLIAPFPEISVEGPGFHVLYRDEAARERGGRAFLRWLQLATRSSDSNSGGMSFIPHTVDTSGSFAVRSPAATR